MQISGMKKTAAMGAIAVLALVGCSSDSGDGSEPSGGDSDVTLSAIESMTDCEELQGIVDASTAASDEASEGDTSDDEKGLADAAQARINELGC